MKALLVLPLALLLGGCPEDAVFDPRGCPRLKQYSRAELEKMAADLKMTPASIKQALVDYQKLRDGARACRGERIPVG